MNYFELSKEVSYALRHAPQEYGLFLDSEGWVDVDDIISALRIKKIYKNIELNDLEKMIVTSEKKRHEILGGRIRALYGHSTEGKILKEPATPPERLFHGTPHRFVENILSEGLLAQKRQYVHLSADIETAFIVGKRRDDSPIIFEINAKNANANGVVFYKGNENIWLSNHVPIQFLKKLK